jgi:hypothetical protein
MYSIDNDRRKYLEKLMIVTKTKRRDKREIPNEIVTEKNESCEL